MQGVSSLDGLLVLREPRRRTQVSGGLHSQPLGLVSFPRPFPKKRKGGSGKRAGWKCTLRNDVNSC